MLAWIKNFFTDLRDRHRYREKISSEHIRQLATELYGLASLAERLPAQKKQQKRIHHIHTEVGKLIELTERIEFYRLSAQRRLELRNSLITSKELMLDSMKNAPAPTERLQ